MPSTVPVPCATSRSSRRPDPRATSAASLTAVLIVATTAACSGGEEVTAAPRAGESACTAALAAAPQTVLNRARGSMDVPGVLVWGQDPRIVLRCGLPEPGPSTLPCLTVEGLDWVIDDTADPVTAVSYGRSPAVEISMARVGPTSDLPAALVDLAPAARVLPGTGRTCTGRS
ncbi:MAG: DUF3515 family protein [Kineosporiaceae bacterium]|nr:DUF3515 family protein [Kineosporiaceae bacterium]